MQGDEKGETRFPLAPPGSPCLRGAGLRIGFSSFGTGNRAIPRERKGRAPWKASLPERELRPDVRPKGGARSDVRIRHRESAGRKSYSRGRGSPKTRRSPRRSNRNRETQSPS